MHVEFSVYLWFLSYIVRQKPQVHAKLFFSYSFHTFISNLIFSGLNVFYVLLYIMLYIIAV